MSTPIPTTQVLARGLQLEVVDVEAAGSSSDFANQDKVLQDLERTQWDLIIIDQPHHCVRTGHNVKSGRRKDTRTCKSVTNKLQDRIRSRSCATPQRRFGLWDFINGGKAKARMVGHQVLNTSVTTVST